MTQKKTRSLLAALVAIMMVLCAMPLAPAFAADDKHHVITYAVDSTQTEVNDDEFTKIWLDKFNFEWEMVPMTFDNMAEKLRIWINTGDMPDFANWHYVHGEALAYAEDDLIRKLPDDWKTRWPNVAKAYDDTGVGEIMEEMFGGTYVLPKPIFSANKPLDVLLPHYGAYMRKDWMEAVGAPIKDYYTIEEFMQIARDIKAQDPGNVGSSLVAIEVPTSLLPWLFIYPNSTYSQTGSQYYKGEDGLYHWGPADQATLEGLKLYKQAYDEGLIHPEFYTLQTGQNGEQTFYSAGTAAINVAAGMSSVANRYATYMKANLNLTPEEDLHYAFTIGLDGKYHAPEVINFYTALIFSPDMPEDRFERLMDILDFSATEEGQRLIRMGIENVDWKWDENGEMVSLLEGGMQVSDKYYSIRPVYLSMYLLSDDFTLVSPAIPQQWRDMARNQYKLKESLSDETTIGRLDFDVYFYDSPAMRKATFDMPQEYAELVLMEGDIEENWNNWVKEKMNLVQPVLDELNALSK